MKNRKSAFAGFRFFYVLNLRFIHGYVEESYKGRKSIPFRWEEKHWFDVNLFLRFAVVLSSFQVVIVAF